MKTLGVIPARWASTRFPGKILAELCGRPLIAWVLERARAADLLDEVLVATDDERIAEAVAAEGGTAVMTRADHPSGTDRVAEAVAGQNADLVVNIQGDEPLVDPALIDRLARALSEDERWDMATAATPIRSEEERISASVVKVVTDRRERALYFSRSLIPFVRDGRAAAGLHWRHIGLYAYRAACLEQLVQTPPCALEQAEMLEQLRALDLGCAMKVIRTDEFSIGVDTPDDVPRAEKLLRNLKAQTQEEDGEDR